MLGLCLRVCARGSRSAAARPRLRLDDGLGFDFFRRRRFFLGGTLLRGASSACHSKGESSTPHGSGVPARCGVDEALVLTRCISGLAATAVGVTNRGHDLSRDRNGCDSLIN